MPAPRCLLTRNTLFIILDDLNAWIGALGSHPDVKTPHIDALAREGVLFSRAYCSAPYCNASRMGLFTGLHPPRNGVHANERFWDVPDRPSTLPEILRQRGVTTIGAGKVFHGVFDYRSATKARSQKATWKEMFNQDELWDAYSSFEEEPLPKNRPLNGLLDFSDFESIPKKYHGFDWGALPDAAEADLPDTRSVSWLVEQMQQGPAEPFFLAAGLYKPHLPWHVPQRFFDLYDRASLSLPLVRQDDLDDVPEIPRGWVSELPDHEMIVAAEQWRPAVHAYLAAISYADEQVGRLVRGLEEAGLRDRTEIVLCSDNGFHLGEKLHWRKFVLWEEATRVPVIVSSPGGAKDLVVDEPVSLIDLFATMLEDADMPDAIPEDSQSVSLRPWLNGERPDRETPVMMTWTKGNHSIRSGPWRYTRYRDGSEELYDHRTDPHEWHNLAHAGRQPAQLDLMRDALQRCLSTSA